MRRRYPRCIAVIFACNGLLVFANSEKGRRRNFVFPATFSIRLTAKELSRANPPNVVPYCRLCADDCAADRFNVHSRKAFWTGYHSHSTVLPFNHASVSLSVSQCGRSLGTNGAAEHRRRISSDCALDASCWLSSLAGYPA